MRIRVAKISGVSKFLNKYKHFAEPVASRSRLSDHFTHAANATSEGNLKLMQYISLLGATERTKCKLNSVIFDPSCSSTR